MTTTKTAFDAVVTGTWHDLPLGETSRGRLRLVGGARRLTVRDGANAGSLLSGYFSGEQPIISAHGGDVAIDYPRHDLTRWLDDMLRGDQRAGMVALQAAVPWELWLTGGVADTDLTLLALALRGLTLQGGVSQVRLALPPAPDGVEVPITIQGGVSGLMISRPVATGLRLRIGGGVSQLRFDQQWIGSQGGESHWESSGAVMGGYAITISGGASQVTVGDH